MIQICLQTWILSRCYLVAGAFLYIWKNAHKMLIFEDVVVVDLSESDRPKYVCIRGGLKQSNIIQIHVNLMATLLTLTVC